MQEMGHTGLNDERRLIGSKIGLYCRYLHTAILLVIDILKECSNSIQIKWIIFPARHLFKTFVNLIGNRFLFFNFSYTFSHHNQRFRSTENDQNNKLMISNQ